MSINEKPQVATDGINDPPLRRADEAQDLLTSITTLITAFIRAADDEHNHATPLQHTTTTVPVLVDPHPPHSLQRLLNFSLPEHGLGREGFLQTVEKTLQYSVNTWSQGFLDKLYAASTPVGLAADLLLSALNTNVHVYAVSPVLTLVERETCRALAGLFGLRGPQAGGVAQPGGSAANLSSLVIARNVLFPETKAEGSAGRRLVVFTSAHGHYSVEKAAMVLGLGSASVRPVAVDGRGRMRVALLERGIREARARGETPFYVNATAGTTVLGSFDPLDAIADVCARERLWLHVDGSWGGGAVFSARERARLRGVERADSVAVCAHKMLNVPLTCSFLLGRDLRDFHRAMTLPAGYLFHGSGSDPDRDPDADLDRGPSSPASDGAGDGAQDDGQDFWDLADLTPQCGRRGDALKLALAWTYHGAAGLSAAVDHAFDTAAHLAALVARDPDLALVSEDPPPCLQVCFYYRRVPRDRAENGRRTVAIARGLVRRGFMTDFADGEEGKFLRVVVNCQTRRETVEGLLGAVKAEGEGMGI